MPYGQSRLVKSGESSHPASNAVSKDKDFEATLGLERPASADPQPDLAGFLDDAQVVWAACGRQSSGRWLLCILLLLLHVTRLEGHG